MNNASRKSLFLTGLAVAGISTFAYFNGDPHDSRASESSPASPASAYTLYGIDTTTGDLHSYQFATSTASNIGTVQLDDGTVLTGVEASAYTPRNSKLFGFWTDPDDDLTKLVYINLTTAEASIVGSDLGSTRVSSAASVKPAAGATLTSNESTPTSEVTEHELFAVLNVPGWSANLGHYRVIVCDPALDQALYIRGQAELEVDGTVQVNSSHTQAAEITSNATIDTLRLHVNGGVNGDPKEADEVKVGVGTLVDPLAAVSAPTWDPADDLGTINYSGGTHTVEPGFYSGGIVLTSDANVTFNPGVYILDGDGLQVSGKASINANGVMFYLTGTGQIALSGQGNIDVIPAPAGPYADISFFLDRASTAPSGFAGQGGMNVRGILYMLNGYTHMSGQGAAFGDWVICQELEISGNGVIKIGTPTGPTSQLVKVNPSSGSVQTVMSLDRMYEGLAAETSAMFYATYDGSLYAIDPVAGSETLVGSTQYSDTNALEFLDSSLCGFTAGTDVLLDINESTGATNGSPVDIGLDDLGTMIFMRNADAPLTTSFD